MNFKYACRSIATLGPIGYLLAPGTMATLVSAPIALWLMSDQGSLQWQLLVAICSTLFSIMLIKYILQNFTKEDLSAVDLAKNDPSEIVLDELIGCLFLFFDMPFKISVFIFGVVIFRILDASKIFGLGYIEKISGAWGIVLDDVAAGIMTNLLLRLLLQFI